MLVDDTDLVDRGEALGHILEQSRGDVGSQRAVVVEMLAQGRTRDELHDQVAMPLAREVRVVQRHERRVIEGGEDARGRESPAGMSDLVGVERKDLHRHIAREHVVARPVHGALAVGAEGLDQPVTPREGALERRERRVGGAHRIFVERPVAVRVELGQGRHTRGSPLSLVRRVVTLWPLAGSTVNGSWTRPNDDGT